MTNNSGHLYETISIEIEQLLARVSGEWVWLML